LDFANQSPWKDLPQQYPLYQTCHRWCQQWVKQEILKRSAQEMVTDRHKRGQIDIREAFIDGSFAPAKKGDYCRKGKARQRHQDHGNRRRFWCSCRRSQ